MFLPTVGTVIHMYIIYYMYIYTHIYHIRINAHPLVVRSNVVFVLLPRRLLFRSYLTAHSSARLLPGFCFLLPGKVLGITDEVISKRGKVASAKLSAFFARQCALVDLHVYLIVTATIQSSYSEYVLKMSIKVVTI